MKNILYFCLLLFPSVLFSQTQFSYLDAQFGDGNGFIIEGLSGSPSAIAVDTGRCQLFVAGNIEVNGISHMLIRCYREDGSVQSSWGNQGEVILDFGAPAYANALSLRSTGFDPALFVAGYIDHGNIEEWALAKLDIAGKIDSSFASDGLTSLAIGPANIAQDIHALPNGGVIISGETGFNVAAAKYLFSGLLDPTFGTAGILNFDVAPLDQGGHSSGDGPDYTYFVLATISNVSGDNTIVLTKFDLQGQIDHNFGQNGVLSIDPMGGEVGMQMDMQIVGDKLNLIASWGVSLFNEAILYSCLDTTTWSLQSQWTATPGSDHRLGGFDIVENGEVVLGHKALINGVEELSMSKSLAGSWPDIHFAENGVLLSGLNDIFPASTYGDQLAFHPLGDQKYLFATSIDTGAGPQWLLAKIANKRLIQSPPDVSDSLLTFSLNKGNRAAKTVLAVDMDRDGDKDVITHDDNQLYIVETINNVDGSGRQFFNPLWNAGIELPYTIQDIDTLDMDGDGIFDLLASCEGALILVPLQEPDSFKVLATGNFPESETGDIDQNGLTDIATIDTWNDTMMVIMQQGVGQFSKTILLSDAGNTHLINLFDLDQDTDLDLVAGGDWTVGGGSNIWYNDGQGNLGISTSLTPGATGDFHLEDLNQNGTPELLYYDISGPSPDLWYLNLSDPVGSPQLLVSNVSGSGWFKELNGQNGHEALLFNKISRELAWGENIIPGASNLIDSISYFQHANLQFYDGVDPNNKDHFAANYNNNGNQQQLFYHSISPDLAFWRWPQTFAYHPHDLADLDLMDFDGDGDLDILSVDAGLPNNARRGSRLLYYENINGYLFQPFSPPVASHGIHSLAVANTINDPALDLVWIAKETGKLEGISGGANMDFDDNQLFEIADSLLGFDHLQLTDFEGDQVPDAVLCSSSLGLMVSIPALDGSSKDPAYLTHSLQNPFKTITAWNDTMMVIAIDQTGICTWRPSQDQECHSLSDQLIGKHPSDIVRADLNQDGFDDFVVSHYVNGNITGSPASLVAYIYDQNGGFNSKILWGGSERISAIDFMYEPSIGNLLYAVETLPGQSSLVHILRFSPNSLDSIQSLTYPIEGASSIAQIKVGDLNDDLIPDFVALDQQSGNIWLSLVGSLPQSPQSTPIEKEISRAPIFKLYPNPSDGQLWIETAKSQPLRSIKIQTIAGQSLYYSLLPFGEHRIELDLAFLPAGLYLVGGESQSGTIHWQKWLKE